MRCIIDNANVFIFVFIYFPGISFNYFKNLLEFPFIIYLHLNMHILEYLMHSILQHCSRYMQLYEEFN